MASPETERMFVFAKGSEVEVTSDEEGFKGAWYRATLEETPTRCKRKKLLVKYAILVDADGSTPLSESFDPAFIRPVPPEDMTAGLSFEEGDVIDADYRDGWWAGVVRKTLESGRYIVYFDNPPDVIEFDGKDLRPHLDWSGGKWVRPEKQQPSKSIFSSGTTVEVRPEEEDLQDTWVPALVVKENENSTFYVKHKATRSSYDVDAIRVVEAHCIRPIPPLTPTDDREYDLLEHVDTVDELGWRQGVIIKLLTGKRYTVYFKSRNESKEFGHLEIRPRLVWNNGLWQVPSRERLFASKCQAKSGHTCNGTERSQQFLEPKKGPCAFDNKTEERTPTVRTRKKWGDHSTSLSESYALFSAKKMRLTVSIRATKQSILAKSSNGENAAEAQVSTGGSMKIHVETPTVQAQHNLSTPRAKRTGRRAMETAMKDQNSTNREILLSEIAARKKWHLTGELGNKIADDAKNGNLPARSPWMIASRLKAVAAKETRGKASSEKTLKLMLDLKDSTDTSIGGKDTDKNIQKKKRGRPRKLISPALPQAVGDMSGQRAAGASSDHKVKELEKAVAEDINSLSDDDRPLSAWIGGNLSSEAVELRLSSARNGVSNAEAELNVACIESLEEDTAQDLPFVKRSPLWKTIESMEVFRIVPQRPHFAPLLETKEEFREGSAIGVMVTFSGLFEKVVNLQFDDPRTTFDSIIGSLLDLEKHGFDITVPLARINELLSIKDRERQMIDESKDVEKEIIENKNKKRKCEEDMEEITRKIVELKHQEAGMKKVKESMDKEISRLQLHAVNLNQKIQKVEQVFRKMAAGPWKSH